MPVYGQPWIPAVPRGPRVGPREPRERARRRRELTSRMPRRGRGRRRPR